MTDNNGWLLLDVLDRRHPGVVMVGNRVKQGVSWRSVVRRNHDEILATVLRSCRTKTATTVQTARSRQISAVPVVERVHTLVHGVWVCTHEPSTPPPAHPPTWAFLWDLDDGSAVRSEAVGVDWHWADIGVPVRRPIADAMRQVDLEQMTTKALALLASKLDGSVHRQTVVEHRPDDDHKVHFVARMMKSGTQHDCAARFVRGLSVDFGRPQSVPEPSTNLGDRIADALTPQLQYRAIADPVSLNLLYWHGPPAPRIAWMAGNTAQKPVLHPQDMPAALAAAQSLIGAGPAKTVELTARFLTLDNKYEPIHMTASLIDLDSGARALLVVLCVE
ncbi:GAF domain-containing protein [Rhodococcus sp. KRD162]|uniref:GAF domain-containing protein n=1 Tax=Rhodococcus sp. KRD162 TaxID=2729725 RepID=UPI0027DE30D4|nr:GAF domain-containing protein [Rhodococcus sp. KRD162]